MACLFEYVVTLPASSVQLQCSATTKYNYNNTALHFFGRLLSCHCITNIVKLDLYGNAIFALISKETSRFDMNSAGKWHRNLFTLCSLFVNKKNILDEQSSFIILYYKANGVKLCRPRP